MMGGGTLGAMLAVCYAVSAVTGFVKLFYKPRTPSAILLKGSRK